MEIDQSVLHFFLLASGVLLGSLALWIFNKMRLGGFKTIVANILKKAEFDGDNIRKAAQLSAKQFQIDQQKELDQLWQTERRKIFREEERLKQREDKLEARIQLVEKKLADIEKRESLLAARQDHLEQEKKENAQLQIKLRQELEKIAGLSFSEAKEMLINRVQDEIKKEIANLLRRAQKEAEEDAEKEAAKIITTAINRLASSCVSEATVNTVSIPNEDMKGRIIGREGRNIRTLERATGVNFIIDETPNAIVLSGFDPIRMQIAKIALTDLITDGRIHPTRIEEAVDKAKNSIQRQIKQYGDDAALRAGVMNLHPELIQLLGKLKFRYSYGQNVLDHSLEVSHLMGLMAGELGLNIRMAKRIGLLHDVGKAVSHEIEGTHAVIGHDFALKYGETKEVANGIGCHHFEMEPISVEGSLCSAADTLSASRPGARTEAVDEYVKRLKKLEDLAYDFPGVDKAYAMQAGREVRVAVLPDMVDDDGIINLARDLTKRIEQELSYPGKIKVTVIREKRSVEYAV
jgi:ribonucrease Y